MGYNFIFFQFLHQSHEIFIVHICHFLVKFIPNYFIVFWCYCKCFLALLLVQIFYCYFIKFHLFLCWFCVLGLFSIFYSFQQIFGCLRLSLHKIISSLNNNNFISSFPTCMIFLLLPWLIVLVKIFSFMLNKSDKSGNPWLVLDLRGKAFKLS